MKFPPNPRRFPAGVTRYRGRRGSALMSALALVAMTSLLVTGACLLTTSYVAKQTRDEEYARAIDIADAATNYELNYVDTHMASGWNAHTAASPYTGSISGISGSFSVYTAPASGTGTWSPPDDMVVVATGTAGTGSESVSRTISFSARGYSPLFQGDYAVFGNQSVAFSGASSTLTGNLGSNGPITGNGSVTGQVFLGGTAASIGSGITSQGVTRYTRAVDYPTIDTIVAEVFPQGWATLTSSAQLSAQAARIRKFTNTSGTLSPTGTTSANWSASVTDLTNSSFGSFPLSTMILPPGDYYFTSAQLSGQSAIVCDTGGVTYTGGSPGPVRIWMGGSGTQQDTLNINVTFTAADAHYFRLYYNKASALSIGGNMAYYGGIYAIRAGLNGSVTPATLSLAGGARVTGSIIADVVKMGGGGAVTYPTGGLGYAGDYVDKYGFLKNWKELVGTRPRVFSDGTNW
ncbi:DUF7305 domain-containing protein [Fimbriimonas ginsengisoli]|nr:hypothetical protein [Fimbriimonas ginsengisoli]